MRTLRSLHDTVEVAARLFHAEHTRQYALSTGLRLCTIQVLLRIQVPSGDAKNERQLRAPRFVRAAASSKPSSATIAVAFV